MKVLTILGTRPEIIRLSRVMNLLDQYVDHVLVHTGQNYDYELNEIFFENLNVRKPDIFLNIDTSSMGVACGDILAKTESTLIKESPDAVLILGDTNSSLSAIIAKRMHIPIYHMEAGNRCFDWNVPEEVNRHIVDAISDINLVYTEHARRNLLAEGFPASNIFLTGSPMAEVLLSYKTLIKESKVLSQEKLKEKEYFVVSLHREENVDNPSTLRMLMEALNRIEKRYKLPLLVSLHPRTAKRLKSLALDLNNNPFIRFSKPFGFFDYIKLQQHSLCTISDSGTLSEESAILGFPAITPRQAFERPEGLDAGGIIVCGTNPNDILESIEFAINRDNRRYSIPEQYKVTDCANRVLSIILSKPLPQR